MGQTAKVEVEGWEHFVNLREGMLELCPSSEMVTAVSGDV